MLTSPRALPVKAQAGFLFLLWVGLTVGTELLLPLLSYPAVHLTFTGLILFLLFYAKAGGTNPLLIVFLLIGVIAVPLIGTVSPALARGVADGLFFAALVAVGTVYLAGVFFPDPPSSGVLANAAAETLTDSPDSRAKALLALRSLAVLFPLVVVFQLYSMTNASVTLVFAMMLSLEPSYGTHLRAGSDLILANLSGGLVAVVLYRLLVIVPSFPFFLMLTTAAGLIIGNQIFAETKIGKLLSSGVTAVFVVLGPTLTGDAAAGSTLAIRLFFIFAGVIYVVLGFGLLERLTRGSRSSVS